MALQYKEIQYNTIHINLLTGEQQGETYRAIHPAGYVPALVMEGRTLAESVAICEYLDETQGGRPLRPSDPYLRAQMRQLVELINAGTQPLQNLLVLNKVGEEKRAWAQFFVGRGLSVFEQVLGRLRAEGGRGPFCMGDSLTLADCFLVPQLYSARRFEVDLSKFPLCLEVELAVLETPACKASAPEVWQPS